MTNLDVLNLMKEYSIYVNDIFGNHKRIDASNNFIRSLGILPECVVNKVYQVLESSFDRFMMSPLNRVITELENHGVLTFDPFIIGEDNMKALALAWNRYLRIFKNNYFKVTETFDGYIDYSIGSFKLQSYACRYPSDGAVAIPYYCNAINAMQGIRPELWCMPKFHRVFDEYLHGILSERGLPTKITYLDLISRIHAEYDTTDIKTVFSVGDCEGWDLCRFWYTNTKLFVEVHPINDNHSIYSFDLEYRPHFSRIVLVQSAVCFVLNSFGFSVGPDVIRYDGSRLTKFPMLFNEKRICGLKDLNYD